jgi:hypothetical protein
MTAVVIYIVRGLVDTGRISHAGLFAPGLIENILAPGCPVSTSLTEQDKAKLRKLAKGPARVRRPSWPDAKTKLVRQQGAAGPRLENGQSIFAEIACHGCACVLYHRKPHEDALRSWAPVFITSRRSRSIRRPTSVTAQTIFIFIICTALMSAIGQVLSGVGQALS